MLQSIGITAAFKRAAPAAEVQAAGSLSKAKTERTVTAFLGQCLTVTVCVHGRELRGLLDTGSQVTLMEEGFFNEHLAAQVGLEPAPTFLMLKAANGLGIPYVGYATLNFVVGGVREPERGVVIVRQGGLTNPFIIGMNVISACWSALFQS